MDRRMGEIGDKERLAWLRQVGVNRPEDEQFVFPTLRQAVRAFRETQQPSPHPQPPPAQALPTEA